MSEKISLIKKRLSSVAERGSSGFLIKFLLCLDYSSKNPDLIPSMGIAWWNERGVIAYDRDKFCELLDVGFNTLNSYLRKTHFEKIQLISAYDVSDHLGNVSNWTKWTLRADHKFTFNKSTTIDEIRSESITRLIRPPTTLSITAQYEETLPLEVIRLLSNNREMLMKAAVLATDLNLSDEDTDDFLESAAAAWRSYFKCKLQVSIDAFMCIFAPIEKFVQTNIEYLILARAISSQSSNSVTFVDFLFLLTRCGPLESVPENVAEISLRPGNEWEGEGDGGNDEPSFVQGILP